MFKHPTRPLKISILGLLVITCVMAHGCRTQAGPATEAGWLEINGAEIYYKAMGSGPTAFVLHGGPGDSHETMLQLEALADQYRLIFYDQRAAGRSTGDADTASHTVAHFVEDLEQLRLKLAPGKINIIGGSWGTMVGMHYAMKYAENVNALVLLSPMGVRSEYFATYRANIAANRTTEDSLALERITATDDFKIGLPAAQEQFWRTFFNAYFYDPALVDSIRLWFRDTTYAQVPGRYFGLWRFFGGYDLTGDLHRITCPTLIVYGDHDPTPFDYVQPLHEGIAGSQLVTLENVGHWLWVEAPERLIPVVREFLEED